MKLNVVIPRPGSNASVRIRQAAGIVMYERNGALLIDYEGNLYDAENLRTYEQRLMHAAGRAKDQYPTVARSMVHDPSEFIIVGEYDTDTWSATLAPRKEVGEALAEWVPDEFSAPSRFESLPRNS
jgi:hypothetical protein